jgi:CheY-like chemotaxis protein
MIVTRGFLPGLPALIQPGARYSFNVNIETRHTDLLALLASVHDNQEITRKFNNGPELVYNWHDKIILIAEDEDSNFFYLKTALSKTKATVIRAKNGREAVDIVRTRLHIDLVLMDIKMPVMNGIDATKIIKSFKSSLIIIAQTAYANEGDKDIYLNAGCNELLSKPFTRDKLLKTISQYL